MKVAKVLLRWYKSFNVNYMNYPDRRSGVTTRPWNRLGRLSDDDDAFPFIEIPLEDDITTVVGANESGKSHLLSAVSKVLTGQGIPEAKGRTGTYSRTDLCHYTSPRSKNADDWPDIGLQFRGLTQEDLKKLGTASGNSSIGGKAPSESYRLTLILAPDNGSTVAHLYLDNDSPVALDEAKLQAVRGCLPRVEFIKSELAISDQVPISSLLAAYGEQKAKDVFDYNAAQEIAGLIHALTLSAENPQVPADFGKTLANWKNTLSSARLNEKAKAELEALLFRDVMGITASTLRFVAGLSLDDRTHADSLTAKWNKEIDERLNLSHYWQQDDSFALRVNYKQGILFFEITDKTGATYTFRERSSGLRYFLSYYIQAKALEMTSRGRNAIVLMDEPDSFLSILGQRNLLAVFESLVRAESSAQDCQLVYTTHSPFLINRNYPRRLRLVRKGDAEEGTQLIDQAMLRRYEPVRSALGIDCAQTLFMGATNVVVEGPTDQYLLSELVRKFITPDNVSELLDLNSVVMVSAESAPSVEKLLVASQWGDEPVPATVVLLDNDEAGDETKAKITGKQRNCKKLVEEQFVLQIGTVLGGTIEGQKIVTTEDVLPPKLFAEAVLRYVKRWHPEKDDVADELHEVVAKPEFSENGLVAGATKALNELVHNPPKPFDKMGVMHEAVLLIASDDADFLGEMAELRNRLFKLCHEIRRAVSASQQAARRNSGKQSIQRLIDDYFKTHKESSSVFDIQLLLERIQRDTKLLGEDGEKLDASLGRMLNELNKARAADQQHFREDAWRLWKQVIVAIRKNPLEVEVKITEDGPVPVGEGVVSPGTPASERNGSETTQRQPATASYPWEQHMSRNIPDKEMKALIALSGGVCAFLGCNKRLLEPGNPDDDAAFLGEMAHIIADSRQGPRGISPMSDEDRDKHSNLVLLCGDHHKIIDAQPRTYSVSVLRRIKEDHEGRIRRVTSGPASATPITLTREVIHSSLLAVTHLPAAVFAAPCTFHEGQDDQVKQRIHFPDGDSQLVRFILRDNKLFSFHNLNDAKGPFRDVINPKGVETIRSEQWWDDPEGHRRFVTLLNRALYKFAARKQVRFDPAHKRFFFDAPVAGKPRQEQYRPLNAKGRLKRNVVWQPKIKATGQVRNFWWHLAAGLSFLRTDKRQWCLSIRPERHLTSDGVTPLPPKQIGRRVTSKKARMWNDVYLGEVNFWRDYLSSGNQKIVLNFGDQSAVIDTEMLTFNVEWPGIPGDNKPFTNTTYDMDLFSRYEYDDALAGDDLDWGTDDDSPEADEED